MNDFWTAFAAFAAVLTIAGGSYSLGRIKGYRQAAIDLNNERESKRFTEIYAPLMGFFTTCHITTVSGRGVPYLLQRFRNALDFIHDVKLYNALHALFDKQDIGVSGEVEYGDVFPLGKITTHLKGREHFADQQILNLVSQANRAQYEERPEDSELTEADIALFRHVCREHSKLVSRFVGE